MIKVKITETVLRDAHQSLIGKTSGPIPDDIRKRILGDEARITCRPADLMPDESGSIKAQMKGYIEQDEDVLSSYALFPQVAENFFKYRQAQKYRIDSSLVDFNDRTHPV